MNPDLPGSEILGELACGSLHLDTAHRKLWVSRLTPQGVGLGLVLGLGGDRLSLV